MYIKKASTFQRLNKFTVSETHNIFIYKGKNFQLEKGDLIILSGSNGTGKSTFLLKNIGVPSITLKRENRSAPFSDISMSEKKDACSIKSSCQRLFCNLFDALFFGSFSRTLLNLSLGQRIILTLKKTLFLCRPNLSLDEPFIALDHTTTKVFSNFLNFHLENKGNLLLVSHSNIPIKYQSTILLF